MEGGVSMANLLKSSSSRTTRPRIIQLLEEKEKTKETDSTDADRSIEFEIAITAAAHVNIVDNTSSNSNFIDHKIDLNPIPGGHFSGEENNYSSMDTTTTVNGLNSDHAISANISDGNAGRYFNSDILQAQFVVEAVCRRINSVVQNDILPDEPIDVQVDQLNPTEFRSLHSQSSPPTTDSFRSIDVEKMSSEIDKSHVESWSAGPTRVVSPEIVAQNGRKIEKSIESNGIHHLLAATTSTNHEIQRNFKEGLIRKSSITSDRSSSSPASTVKLRKLLLKKCGNGYSTRFIDDRSIMGDQIGDLTNSSADDQIEEDGESTTLPLSSDSDRSSNSMWTFPIHCHPYPRSSHDDQDSRSLSVFTSKSPNRSDRQESIIGDRQEFMDDHRDPLEWIDDELESISGYQSSLRSISDHRSVKSIDSNRGLFSSIDDPLDGRGDQNEGPNLLDVCVLCEEEISPISVMNYSESTRDLLRSLTEMTKSILCDSCIRPYCLWKRAPWRWNLFMKRCGYGKGVKFNHPNVDSFDCQSCNFWRRVDFVNEALIGKSGSDLQFETDTLTSANDNECYSSTRRCDLIGNMGNLPSKSSSIREEKEEETATDLNGETSGSSSPLIQYKKRNSSVMAATSGLDGAGDLSTVKRILSEEERLKIDLLDTGINLPRTKNVCRRRSVIDGTRFPRATFGQEEDMEEDESAIILSALPLREKRTIWEAHLSSDDDEDEIPCWPPSNKHQQSISKAASRPTKRNTKGAKTSAGLSLDDQHKGKKQGEKKRKEDGHTKRESKSGIKRTARCRQCVGCLATDCGVCMNCRDMPRFGGSGALKQACVNRQCQFLLAERQRRREEQRSSTNLASISTQDQIVETRQEVKEEILVVTE